MWNISQIIIRFLRLSDSNNTIMEKYIEPNILVVEWDSMQILCASFDDVDHTERWESDDVETI